MIKAYDTQTVGNAMINAIVAQEVRKQQARLREENEWLKMCRQYDQRRIDRLMRDRMERRYPTRARKSILSSILWALVGWTVLGFDSLIERLGV